MSDCTIIEKPTKRRRSAPGLRSPNLCSAVTNGSTLFVDGADEGPWVRRFRDLLALHADDLGPEDSLSEGQLSLVRRVTTLEIELEQMEGRLSKGEPVDLDLYNRMTGTLGRTLDRLGLKRALRDVTPGHLDDHFSRPPQREPVA